MTYSPMDMLPDLPGLCLLRVSGTQLIGKNGVYNQQFPEQTKDWLVQLGIEDRPLVLDWLLTGDAASSACLASALLNGTKRWWRLRILESSQEKKGERQHLLDLEDVTAAQEMHEKERLESQHFHALIERSAEGISLFDTKANILYESPSNKRIHGYESWEMEGKNLFDFCHQDDLARAMPRFDSLARAPGVVETEIVRFRHKQGHWIYLEGTVINATDDPRVRALVNNFRDVTGRLETDRELRRAKAAAEEAHRLQQHFLTNLSHEFKTPLTLIRGPLIDLAEGRISVTEVIGVIRRVLRNVDRLDGLISELIDLARLDAGTFALRVHQRDFAAFIRHEVDNFQPMATARGIRIEFNGPAACPLFFDSNKLEKAVSNLLGNALRYSPDGGKILVRLDLERETDDSATHVRLRIKDEGPGMDAAIQARVFERFFQADTSDARGHEGMGIGLALAREMVEMHGGVIGVESVLGQGSCFFFTLPLGCEHFDPDDIDTAAVPEPRPHTVGNAAATAQPTSFVPYAQHRPRLLLVEDNEDMRAYLRLNLDPYYTVSEAVDGQAAWETIETTAPEIIVSDVMMPRMDGLSFCRLLKAAPRWREVPLLLLSAKAAVDHRVEGLKAGADDYMGKPLSVVELLHRLRTRVPWGVSADAAAQAWRENLETSIAEHLGDSTFDVGTLARKLGYSQRQLQRRVREYYGMPPSSLILIRRLAKSRELLTTGHIQTMAEAAHAVGLSPAYFSRRYRRTYPD